MFLIISTIERDKIELGLGSQNVVFFNYKTKNQSKDILIKIKKLLKSHRLSLKDITAIFVNQGPGSFTGVRTGIATANALAWSLNIPIIGYRGGRLKDAITKIKENKFSQIVLPYYTDKK